MNTSLRSALTLVLAAASASGSVLHAAVPNRLRGDAATSAPQNLPQGVSPRVRQSTALGHLGGDTRIDTMALVLSPSAAQSAALDQLLADQQNPASPRYHQWITPAQFGAQFGVSDSDLQVLQTWLTSQGFQVLDVAPSRNRITFSGTASTVEAAFHTELDRFRRNGQQFFENSTAPEIPAALQNVVGAISGLSSFRPEPRIHRVVGIDGQRPLANSATGNHYITPFDFRQIYNANGLFNSGQTGTGVKIAVLGQSAVDTQQLTYFQQLTGQTVKAPTFFLLPNTGVSTAYTGDETESEADLEYASGVAPGASVTFIYAGNSSSASVADALNYAIVNNVAPILSYSYGGCETANSVTLLLGEEGYLRQANAQGQTILVASGDTGAAGCDLADIPSAYDGLQVGYPASSPYVTAVGGTSFTDSIGTYWAASNNSQYGSAIGYIPETTWNETFSSTGALLGISGSGGGFSRAFGKPNWQVANGVPADGARDIPDISFSAAAHDAYLICTSDTSFSVTSNGTTSTGQCTATAFGIGRVGGTSLPTPAFAGALAMVLQANSTASVGNLNPLLYSLFSTAPAVFHDVTTGNNAVPCAAGTLGCTNGSAGYAATAGYDLATGLGSLDIGAFSSRVVATAAATSKTPTLELTVLSSSPTNIQVAVRVSSNTAATVPTGSVTVTLDGSSPQTAPLTSSAGSAGAVATVTFTGAYSVGSHTVAATYTGDTSFNTASASAITAVAGTGSFNLTATPSTLTVLSGGKVSGTVALANTNYNGLVFLSVSSSSSLSTFPGCFIGANGDVTSANNNVFLDAGVSAGGTATLAYTYDSSSTDCAAYATGAVPQRDIFTGGRSTGPEHGLPLAAFTFGALSLAGLAARRRRLWSSGLLLCAFFAATVALSGCGSGSTPISNTTPTTPTTGGAAKGTYNLTFTATSYPSGTVTSSTAVTVVIQ